MCNLTVKFPKLHLTLFYFKRKHQTYKNTSNGNQPPIKCEAGSRGGEGIQPAVHTFVPFITLIVYAKLRTFALKPMRTESKQSATSWLSGGRKLKFLLTYVFNIPNYIFPDFVPPLGTHLKKSMAKKLPTTSSSPPNIVITLSYIKSPNFPSGDDSPWI